MVYTSNKHTSNKHTSNKPWLFPLQKMWYQAWDLLKHETPIRRRGSFGSIADLVMIMVSLVLYTQLDKTYWVMTGSRWFERPLHNAILFLVFGGLLAIGFVSGSVLVLRHIILLCLVVGFLFISSMFIEFHHLENYSDRIDQDKTTTATGTTATGTTAAGNVNSTQNSCKKKESAFTLDSIAGPVDADLLPSQTLADKVKELSNGTIDIDMLVDNMWVTTDECEFYLECGYFPWHLETLTPTWNTERQASSQKDTFPSFDDWIMNNVRPLQRTMPFRAIIHKQFNMLCPEDANSSGSLFMHGIREFEFVRALYNTKTCKTANPDVTLPSDVNQRIGCDAENVFIDNDVIQASQTQNQLYARIQNPDAIPISLHGGSNDKCQINNSVDETYFCQQRTFPTFMGCPFTFRDANGSSRPSPLMGAFWSLTDGGRPSAGGGIHKAIASNYSQN